MNGDTKIIVDLVNNRIDGVERQIERQIDKLDKKVTDKVHNHCIRIRALEALKNLNTGKMSVISAVIAIGISLFFVILNKI